MYIFNAQIDLPEKGMNLTILLEQLAHRLQALEADECMVLRQQGQADVFAFGENPDMLFGFISQELSTPISVVRRQHDAVRRFLDLTIGKEQRSRPRHERRRRPRVP